jgi:hypothetical protein
MTALRSMAAMLMARRTRTSSSGFFVVDGQDGLGARAADHHLKARVGLELRHAARRDAGEGVHVAGQQAATCAAGSEMKRKVARAS